MAISDRGSWGSRTAFIFAAAGSAVGLGNIWGFPTRVGQNGGAAFVVVYLACVLLVCAPILLSELLLGRGAQRGPVGAFKFFSPNSRWWLVGVLGVVTGMAILSFYSVIAGWALAYIWLIATGAVGKTAEEVSYFFTSFTAKGGLSIALTFLILAATAASILGGVRHGIERVTKTLMPLLIFLLFVLAVRAITLPGAHEGLSYYLKPDFSALTNISVLHSALGQAFFSLSLGMGALITYGSYMSKKDSLAGAALWVIALDTSIALLAGFIIFPTGFSNPNFDPTASGPGLIFTVLPQLFASLPGGYLFGTTFFLLLTMAALTSTISLLEVPVSHCIDEYNWSRKKAVVVLMLGTFVLAIPSALGNGASGFFSDLPGVGTSFLSLMDNIWNNYSLPIGGLLVSIFVAQFLGTEKAIKELTANSAWFPNTALWSFLIRFVSPLAIALIILWPLIGQLLTF